MFLTIASALGALTVPILFSVLYLLSGQDEGSDLLRIYLDLFAFLQLELTSISAGASIIDTGYLRTFSTSAIRAFNFSFFPIFVLIALDTRKEMQYSEVQSKPLYPTKDEI